MSLCVLAEIWEKKSKNINKSLSSIYSQKLSDHARQSAVDTLKSSSKRAVQETAKATGDLIADNIADKTTSLKNLSTQ